MRIQDFDAITKGSIEKDRQRPFFSRGKRRADWCAERITIGDADQPAEGRIGVDERVLRSARDGKGERRLLHVSPQRVLNGTVARGCGSLPPSGFHYSYLASVALASFRKIGTPVIIPSYSVSGPPTTTPLAVTSYSLNS
jgi:hypothetical protein